MKKAESNPSEIDMKYELPDGRIITLSSERFLAPEVLFKPKLGGFRGCPSTTDCVAGSICQCDPEMRSELFDNIVLSGGNTLFRGFARRLTEEMHNKYTPKNQTVSVLKEREFGAWIGGSILSSLESFTKRWIFRKSYEEHVARAVKAGCSGLCVHGEGVEGRLSFLRSRKDVDLRDEEKRLEFVTCCCRGGGECGKLVMKKICVFQEEQFVIDGLAFLLNF